MSRRVTLEEMRVLFDKLGDQLPEVAKPALEASAQAMLRDVVLNRLTAAGPLYLNVDTGKGRDSIVQDVKVSADRIEAAIGTGSRYMIAHERGFHGAVNVRGHTRTKNALVVRGSGVTKKSAAAFKAAGGSTRTFVRPHKRVLRIRARRFLRDTVLQEAGQLPISLVAGRPPVEARLDLALRIFVSQGRVATAGELAV